jgi:chemotaxis regulatin CheY-phosphate phosphatase CheZ
MQEEKQLDDSERKPLRKILEVTEAISKGDFSKEVVTNTEGIIGELAYQLNQAVRNFRSAFPSFTEATNKTPDLAHAAQSVGELMENSTQVVLDKSDEVLQHCETLNESLGESGSSTDQQQVKEIQSLMYDIMSSQSYQDTAKQSLEKMEKDLSQLRDTLLDAMIVMNLREGNNVKELNEKRKQLIEAESDAASQNKQDLVDDLLAEFGM